MLGCPKCGAKKDLDVIAALGVCQSCVTLEAIDELIRESFRRHSPALAPRGSQMRVLIDFVRHPHRQEDRAGG